LPGFEGAEAIAGLISGSINPSGKLPFSYPQHTGHYLNYNHKSSDVYFFNPQEANHIAQGSPNTSLFQFGDGLSYTQFEYSDLVLDQAEVTDGGTITASVTVTNTGDREGMESVLWFTRDMVGSITRPVKELKHFEKIQLEPGESRTVTFAIVPEEKLWFPDEQGNKLLEPGAFSLMVGGLQTEFTLQD
jgi:beta-glucosidase